MNLELEYDIQNRSFTLWNLELQHATCRALYTGSFSFSPRTTSLSSWLFKIRASLVAQGKHLPAMQEMGSMPVLGSSWRRKGQPSQYSAAKCHGQRSLDGYSERNHKESNHDWATSLLLNQAAWLFFLQSRQYISPNRLARQIHTALSTDILASQWDHVCASAVSLCSF